MDRIRSRSANVKAKFPLKAGSCTPAQAEQRRAADLRLSAEPREAYNTAAKEVARAEAEIRDEGIWIDL